jgi:hypothetical protein
MKLPEKPPKPPKKPLTYAQQNERLLERLLARIEQAKKIRKRTS